MRNRIDDAFERTRPGLKAPMRFSSCSLPPLKPSWRILPGTVGSIKVSGIVLWDRGRHVRESGASFERALKRGNALAAPDVHRAQSRGTVIATSFQRRQARRKLNVPVAKPVSSSSRSDSTMWRKTSARSSAARLETGTWEFWADFNRLIASR